MANKMQYHVHSLLYCLHIIPLVCCDRPSITLNGAGASLPSEVYTTWMAAYKAQRNTFIDLTMSYDPRGSGHGKARIKGEIGSHVEYAGSDSLLKDEEYEEHKELQMFPTMAG